MTKTVYVKGYTKYSPSPAYFPMYIVIEKEVLHQNHEPPFFAESIPYQTFLLDFNSKKL
jgi:hypothetical protein